MFHPSEAKTAHGLTKPIGARLKLIADDPNIGQLVALPFGAGHVRARGEKGSAAQAQCWVLLGAVAWTG